jgi:hypothetical protein
MLATGNLTSRIPARIDMKAKTIRRVLSAKIKDWVEHIDDPEITELVKKNTIVTGGSIASMLLKESVNDFDVYFKSFEAVQKVAQYYVDKYIEGKSPSIIPEVHCENERCRIVVKSAGIAQEGVSDTTYQYFETLPEDNVESSEYVEPTEMQEYPASDDTGDKYRPVFMSSNAITLSGKIQIVLRFWGSPDQIHENYDFAHCTSWWSSWDDNLELRPEAMEALLARELRYQGSKYPLCSIIRTRKFIKRGYSVNAGQYLKMCMQLSELDLKDVDVLEDQLTGVDVAYFHQIIAYLRDSKKDFSAAYICEIVDKIF